MAAKGNRTHPLYGANLGTLYSVWRRTNDFAPGAQMKLLAAAGSALGRLPFSLVERGYVRLNRSKAENMPAPVFILGHWRSGTTHLYNVLSKADNFGYVSPFATALPWDFMLLGHLLEPMLTKKLPEHRYIDRVAVDPDSPQEDEIALANMTDLSYYHALYFPKKFEYIFNRGVFFDNTTPQEIARWKKHLSYLYLKLSLDQPGQRLLIKNPAYTARPGLLRQIWPNAKFIHIHRNPLKVFMSMRNFYHALFSEFALQDWSHVDIDAIIFATYERMMERLQQETADLPSEQFIELRFEDFQADPMTLIEQIYRRLDIPGFEQAQPAFTRYIDSVSGYQKNSFTASDDVRKKVAAHWGRFIHHWGYEDLI